MTNDGEAGMKNAAEVDQDVLEERHGEAVCSGSGVSRVIHKRGAGGDDHLQEQLARAPAGRWLLRCVDLAVVVEEADRRRSRW